MWAKPNFPSLKWLLWRILSQQWDIVSTLDSVVERPWLTRNFISCQAHTGSSRTYRQTPHSRSSAWAAASKDASLPDLAECTGFIFFSSRSLSTFSNCESQPHMRPWNWMWTLQRVYGFWTRNNQKLIQNLLRSEQKGFFCLCSPLDKGLAASHANGLGRR